MSEPTGDGIVQIAYLHAERVSHSWVESMRKAWQFDREVSAYECRLAPNPLNMRCTSASIMTARNFATRLFLERTPHEWLMFIDTDMGFEPDAIHRLLEVADPSERPIVGGLCFAQYEAEYDGKNGYRHTIQPTLYRIGTTAEGRARFCFYGDYERDAVIQVAATGAAFLLIHRSVLEQMEAKHGKTWWTQTLDEDGDIVGEDMAFCMRALAMGLPIHVNTAVKTNHHKEIWLQEDDYLQQAVLHGSLVSVKPLDVTLPDGRPLPAELAPVVDVGESLATLARGEHDHDGMLKLPQDLDRYAQIIADTKPDLIIETGTWNGGSAEWFARKGIDVISIDIDSQVPPGRYFPAPDAGTVEFIRGGSTDRATVDTVDQMVADIPGRRVMVVLDSDHHAEHVAREIALYGPLVTSGCYLVVEDTLHDYAPVELLQQHYPNGDLPRPGPLAAVAEMLLGDGRFARDLAIERKSSVSHAPAGWWLRRD